MNQLRPKKIQLRLNTPTNHNRPYYRGFQLLGDSNLLRFAKQICHCVEVKESFIHKAVVRHVQFVISGQSVQELLTRVQTAPELISSRIILMIGTNSIRRRIRYKNIVNGYRRLLNALKKAGVTELYICLIPPLLKYKNSKTKWKKICQFNKLIRPSAKGFGAKFIDVFDHFAPQIRSTDPKHRYHRIIRSVFFQRFYHSGKVDGIHLNKKGISELRRLFDQHLATPQK